MLQLSKIKKSRDEWREKAKKRAEELWEMRKVHKPKLLVKSQFLISRRELQKLINRVS